MVDASSQNSSISINASSSGNSASINATPDTAIYYSEKAREWAISNRIVDGVDYSSKYYAGKANESALNAQSFAQSAQNSYNNFQDSIDGALSNIDSSVQGAINDINNTKTTIITDIEFVADGEKKEIEDLIDNGKEELKESIGDVKVLTTLEIGDIGFTQMAIDETKGKRRALNKTNNIIIQEQYKELTQSIKKTRELFPELFCTEEEWQAELAKSVIGLCDKYVIDDEAGTIRLPKYPNYFIGGVNNIAPVAGNGMTLGIMGGSTGESTYGLTCKSGIGFTGSGGNYGTPLGSKGTSESLTPNYPYGITTDPTKSGIEAQIKQEQIKGTYFIQVATGAETEDNIINEIELNNPFSLLDYKYSQYELNNLSWLRSNGQYNSKAVYPAVYDLLLKIYNGTEIKAGVSVKLTTETFTDYDFVLNTADEAFRLPLKVKLASGKAVAGNGMALGLTDGTNYGGLSYPNTDGHGALLPRPLAYGENVGFEGSVQVTANNLSWGVTTDPTKSGIETSDSGLYLYFYVGETVQNANLINAGRIEEVVATRTDKVQAAQASMPSSRHIDLTLGASGTTYTAPANGWFVFAKIIGTANTYNSLQNLTSGVQTDCASSATGLWGRVYVPCKKGDEIKVEYKSTGETKIFRFIYAEGEV